MKTFLTLFILFIAIHSTAQLGNVLERAKQKTKSKIDQRIDQKMDKAIGSAVDSVDTGISGGNKTKTKSSPSPGATSTSSTNNDNGSNPVSTTGGSLKSYSKFDFVPGEKIVATEDFSQDEIGDFPDKWNTNSSGEVVTLSGKPGKWLMLNKKGKFIPEYIKNLPENFTLQFDVICNEKFSYYSNPLHFYFLTGGQTKSIMEYNFIGYEKRSAVKLGIHPSGTNSKTGTASVETFEDGTSVIKNETATNQFVTFTGKTQVKVSIWRQKQRVRMYLNEEKVLDLPRAFATGKTYNTMMFDIWSNMHNEEDRYLISNIKLAAGAPDTRNKLITEGKFVTHGILFDVNSDVIKPESYGAIKDIANVLSENSSVKVKIVGHTDSDGDDKRNLELSRKRAEAVRQTLSREFGIDASRIETDGKGKTMPIDKNTTAEGKANNRRVEFIKL